MLCVRKETTPETVYIHIYFLYFYLFILSLHMYGRVDIYICIQINIYIYTHLLFIYLTYRPVICTCMYYMSRYMLLGRVKANMVLVTTHMAIYRLINQRFRRPQVSDKPRLMQFHYKEWHRTHGSK